MIKEDHLVQVQQAFCRPWKVLTWTKLSAGPATNPALGMWDSAGLDRAPTVVQ